MFSFAVKTDHRSYLWRFLVIAALTFAMNAVVTYLLDFLLVQNQISIAIVTTLIPLTNYFCNRFWVLSPGLWNDCGVARWQPGHFIGRSRMIRRP
jgi:putative flippase GtrA